ncbi:MULTISPECIES: hypothetical protein [Methylobacterium]|jgi:hypothetical protein|uniref:hypothetical protein n=1 Tax=Methylobacterium TaxID=407 RepID=UPI0012EDCB12|nr:MULTISPECIES: hypothetical protein [Methylobacterium]NGM37324.1 hypothetical protein [Methylobacterium sp. DB0501]UHC20320.1 hypothetical protein LRS73_34320 [Methylobacterium currus]
MKFIAFFNLFALHEGSKMADICIFPEKCMSDHQADRLCFEFSKADIAGVDLGSRTKHMRSLSQELDLTCDIIRSEIKKIEDMLINLDLPHEGIGALARSVIADAENIKKIVFMFADVATQQASP